MAQGQMAPDEQLRLRAEIGKVFNPAAPVEQQALFAGRIEQIKTLFDAINQRGQHAIIYGERGVGKTSLANILQQLLATAGQRAFALRFNGEETATFDSVWRKMFGDLQATIQKRGAGFTATQTEQVVSLAKTLPNPMSPDDVRRVLATFDASTIPILIIDEFDRIPGDDVRRLFADTIKTLSDHSVNATVVIVGVGNTVDELIKEHRSIDRALVQIPMPRMDQNELQEIVDKGLKRVGMTIDGDAAEHITALSQGLPYYTHLLTLNSGFEAVDGGTKHVTMGHVDAAIRKSIERTSHSIRSDYDKAVQSPQKGNLYKQVLLACALAKTSEMGFFSAANVRDPLRSITKRSDIDIPNFAQHLNNFSTPERGEVLEKSGQKHRITFRFRNPLMQPFVAMRGYSAGVIDLATLRASGRVQATD